MPEIISVNGVIYDPANAVLPAMDRGFLFGDDVFETLVAFSGTVLNIDRHIARLRRSADELGFEIPWSDAEINFEIKSLAESLDTPKAQVRYVVSRGNGLGLRPPQGLIPNKVIYVMRARSEPSWVFTDGIAVKRRALPYTERGAQAKTGNYVRSILALASAEKEGYHEVLWSNSEGEITEATTANIFFIGRQGDQVEIATPSIMSGILPGITRDTLLGLLARAQIRATEQVIYADEIARFDEAFLCSTVRGLVPLSRIDNHRLSTTRPGSVFHQIERLRLAWVESQLGYRVNWNTGEQVKVDQA